jgi:hypothetical protein
LTPRSVCDAAIIRPRATEAHTVPVPDVIEATV